MIGTSRNKDFINKQDWERLTNMNRSWSNYFYSSTQMTINIINTEDKYLSSRFLCIGSFVILIYSLV